MAESKKKKGKPKAVGAGAQRQYTPETLVEIENAVSNGAQTGPAIAAAIGVTPQAFNNHRYRKTSPETTERADAIERAIKRGQSRRRESIKSTAEDALLKLIKGFELTDEIEEVRKKTAARPKGWKPGDPEPSEEVNVYKRRTIKRYGPNVTAVLFALVNSDPERWQSIYSRSNADDVNENENRGTIANWMRQQVEAGARMNSKRNGGGE